MPPTEPNSEFKYWAFISYSHSDDTWANWIHKGLETYQVPKHLVGKPTRDGVVPKRAFPVFRDRDELPGSANLGDNLERALRLSRYLVVICSPRSAKSQWVDQEIRIFKSLGREDRVLCLIVDGEPNCTSRPQPGMEECFPEAIRFWVDHERRITTIPTEPIAADGRKGKDGKESAKLKLLAGILGVSFDDLKQRDAERSHRRMQMLLTGVSILLAVFGLMALEMYRRGNEAQENERQAKDNLQIAKKERVIADQKRNEAVAAQAATDKALAIAQEERVKAQEAEAQAKQSAEKARQSADDAKKSETKAKEQQKIAEDANLETKRALADAQAARDLEAKARQEADAKEQKIRRTLSLSDLTTASRLIVEGSGAKALAYLARALSYDQENAAIVSRTVSLMSQRNWPLPIIEPLVHGNPVVGASISPDGKSILTYGRDARLWDAATGKPLMEPLKAKGVLTAAFSPDGKWVATGSDDGRARIWSAVNGQMKTAPAGLKHEKPVNVLAFSPDSKFLATGSQDQTVKVWNLDTEEMISDAFVVDPKLISTLPTQMSASVTALAMSPTEKILVATSSKGECGFWNYAENKQVGELLKPADSENKPWQHSGGIYSVAFSPNGKWVVTGSFDKSARVWNAATARAVGDPMLHKERVNAVAFSPDSKFVATGCVDGIAQIWEAGTTNKVGSVMMHEGPVNLVRFSANGRWLATSSEDGTARLWDAATGISVIEPMRHAQAVKEVAFGPRGRSVVTASSDGTAKLWSVTSGKMLVEPLLHEQRVTSAAFSPDGKWLATISNDRKARLWDVVTGLPLTDPLDQKGIPLAVAFSPDGKLFATGSQDYSARVYSAPSGKLLHEEIRYGGAVTSVAFSPDSKWLATASQDDKANVWDAATGKAVSKAMVHDSGIKSICFTGKGDRVVTGSADGSARIWDARTGDPVGQPLKAGTGAGELRSVDVTPDGSLVVVGSDDRKARIWDTASGKILQTLDQGETIQVVAFAPLPAGATNQLVMVASEKTVLIWSALTGNKVTEPVPTTDQIKSASFSPDGALIVIASGKSARVLESGSGKLVSEPLTHDDYVLFAHFSPDGKNVVTTSQDDTARVWLVALPGKSPDWLRELAAVVGGYSIAETGAAELARDTWVKYSEMRGRLASADGGDIFATWGRWMVENRATRTISAFEAEKVDDYVHNRLQHGGAEALNEVLDLQPDSGLALIKLARVLKDPAQVDFYSKLAQDYEPANPDVLWVRAALLQEPLKQLPEAFAVMERALAVDPRNVTTFGPDGAEISRLNSEGNVSKGWIPKGWEDGNSALPLGITYTKLTELPPGVSTGVRLAVTGQSRGFAQFRGPHFILRAKGKAVIEGSIRGQNEFESINVVARSFLDLNAHYGDKSVPVPAKGAWKPFKVPIDLQSFDIAGEIALIVPAGATVEVAGVALRLE